MHADLTRWTFDPTQGYRSVLMQQGRVLLDAEWNEQAAIDAHHDEVRTADVVGTQGGPAPLDGGVGPFAVVDTTTGLPPATAVPWASLGVTPGRYYVDGVLVESLAASPLAHQPFLDVPEPGTGRWAAYLDVFDRLVTADERPELLESALGGPDTAFRTQTAWQVRLAHAETDAVCSDLADAGERTPRAMRVRLRQATATDDPCSIASGGGYTRLENQLYRVEVYDVVAGTARFVWSRENGSVVAGLDALEDSPLNGALAQLTVDRTGRDDELSIGPGSWVEVTSPQRQVRGLPGWVAQVTDLFDTQLHVAWFEDHHPASLAEVGETPVVRRWERAPRQVSTAFAELEGGIEVAFPAGGQAAAGDYWLVPARTSLLAYGVAATHGTIEWPWSSAGTVALPPAGPVHHVAALAVLEHTAGGWTLVGDCRRLFPPLTGLVTIDLVGGDGQEAMPGAELPAPVRVVVRNGGIPVSGALVFFSAPDGGTLRDPDDPLPNVSNVSVLTDADGVADVFWTLAVAPGAPTTQTLVAHRLDDHRTEIDVDVIVAGRLSVANQVAWTPPCDGFADTGTVQDALARIATTRSIRLLGGDGQEVAQAGLTVPRLVRVAVDSPCGPAAGATVVATGTDGALVAALPEGGAVPGTLAGAPGAGPEATTVADADGVAAFAWQPAFVTARSDVLRIDLPDSDEASIQVTAQLDPPGTRTEGIHVRDVRIAQKELLNDEVYRLGELVNQFFSIGVGLDAPVEQASVQGKPVVRLLLDLPWPLGPEAELFGSPTWGRRTIEIAGDHNADGALIVWWPLRPLDATLKQVTGQLRTLADRQQLGEPPRPLLLRFQIDGWAVCGDRLAGLERLHLNGHTDTFMDDDGRTRQALPSTDEVTGGRFETWFWITDEPPTPAGGPIRFPGRIAVAGPLDLDRFGPATADLLRRLRTVDLPVVVPPRPLPDPRPGPPVVAPAGPVAPAAPGAVTDALGPLDALTGRTLGFVERRATGAGVTLDVVEEDAAGRRNTVLGTELLAGNVLRVRVSRGATPGAGDPAGPARPGGGG